METLLGYGLSMVHAMVSPVNCLGHLGGDILTSLGNFVSCVGANVSGSAHGALQTGATIVTNTATTVGSIGG